MPLDLAGDPDCVAVLVGGPPYQALSSSLRALRVSQHVENAPNDAAYGSSALTQKSLFDANAGRGRDTGLSWDAPIFAVAPAAE